MVMEKINEQSERNYVLVSLHSQERSVIRTASDFARTNNIYFLRLLNKDQRNVTVDLMGEEVSFDPNRIFTADGIKSILKRDGSWSKNTGLQVQKFARFLFAEMKREVVVSIHEKDREYTMHDYLPGGRFARQSRASYYNTAWDAADMFITTDEKYYHALKERKCNVVWQNRGWAKDDGSLTVYCDKQKKPYIQIEVRPDHREQLHEMLATIDDILK